jgi:metal-responsive CopG/Arc/MetJ family transcriptional regulator
MQTRISITIDPDVLAQVDSIRGMISRSKILTALIQKGLSGLPKSGSKRGQKYDKQQFEHSLMEVSLRSR